MNTNENEKNELAELIQKEVEQFEIFPFGEFEFEKIRVESDCDVSLYPQHNTPSSKCYNLKISLRLFYDEGQICEILVSQKFMWIGITDNTPSRQFYFNFFKTGYENVIYELTEKLKVTRLCDFVIPNLDEEINPLADKYFLSKEF